MQIYEVKNNIAEILYAPAENKLFLSDFLFIEDNESTIVSQVTDISTTDRADINIATTKFYLSVDKDNKLTAYDGHTPSKDSEVGYLDANEIVGLFRPKTKEMVWGSYLRHPDLKVSTDLKFLSAKSCAICDRAEQSAVFVKNLLYSLEKANAKTVLLDFEGKYKRIKTTTSAIFGKDYRIPLNSKALDYIFENDLNDCPIDAKAIIQNIILEIQKYVETLEEGFIPFDTFFKIILSECKNSDNTGLLIFSNKLMQYKQKKIFADEESQFANINNCIGSFKLDISDIDNKYHALIFSSVIANLKKKFYVISDMSEDNITNEELIRIYEKQNVRLIPIVQHDDKFLNRIKAYCKNLIIFAPAVRKKSEEPYGSFMDKLSQNEFILWGENTLFIPLIVSLKSITKEFADTQNEQTEMAFSEITNADLDDLDFVNSGEIIDENLTEKIDEENPSNIVTEEDLDSLNDELTENLEQPEEQQEENTEPENTVNEQVPIDSKDNLNSVEEPSLSPKKEEQINRLYQTTPQPAFVENQEPVNVQPIEEPQNAQNVSNIQENISPQEPLQKNQPIANENRMEIHVQEKPAVPVEKPMPKADELPIYEPKEISDKEVLTYNEGERVLHAKYGEGTIEKIIKYGKKTLCSIQFDNVGRRLLDPNITTLEKV